MVTKVSVRLDAIYTHLMRRSLTIKCQAPLLHGKIYRKEQRIVLWKATWGVVDGDTNVSQHVDLLIGMVPIVNLEWIQKFVRDTRDRGHSREAVTDSIVRSMDDYLNYITPQFSRTHINFQRVPTVDTSNPLNAKGIPSLDESFVVIRLRGMKNVDFPYLLAMIDGSFMSRHNTLVIPGGKMSFAMELIIRPILQQLIETGKIG